MSVRIIHSVEIARPPSACWRLLTDVAGWPRWFPMLEAARRERSGDFAVGERIELRLSFRGHAVDVQVRIEEVEPGLRVRWIGRSLGVHGDHSFSIESLGGRSRYTSEEVWSGLPVRLVPKRVFAELEAETRAGLERFRHLAEQAPDSTSP